jgi:uncharacterized protein YdeI (YjbR/CyaY-like superfamily)
MHPESDIFQFANQNAWADWLLVNHLDSQGIWIRIGKKKSGIESITYEEAVETALCNGWIDAIRKSFDENTFIQRFTPRKPKSIWSLVNRQKALQLIEEGKMLPAGMAAIETARKNGRWENAYAPQSTITIPPDLELELNKSMEARSFFESLDSQNRYAILHRVQTAIKPETRAKRIKKFVAMLDAKQKIY